MTHIFLATPCYGGLLTHLYLHSVLALTAQGAAVWAEMRGSIRAYYDEALGGFSTQDCVTLFRLLDRLRDGLAALSGGEADA